MAGDKPVGAALGWRLLNSTQPYANPWIKLRSDELEVRGRGKVQYSYVQHPGGVLVVPVTATGQILMIRQYRYPVDAWCREIPAGGMHEQADVEATARRELLEEAGATCGHIQVMTKVFVSNSLMDEVCAMCLAWDCVAGPKQALEPAEFIEREPVPAKQALEWARSGGVEDAKSALALLMAEPYLRAKGFV